MYNSTRPISIPPRLPRRLLPSFFPLCCRLSPTTPTPTNTCTPPPPLPRRTLPTELLPHIDEENLHGLDAPAQTAREEGEREGFDPVRHGEELELAGFFEGGGEGPGSDGDFEGPVLACCFSGLCSATGLVFCGLSFEVGLGVKLAGKGGE